MALIRLLVAAQIALISSASLAAEKPSDAASWPVATSAFYVGVNGGVAWAQERLTRYGEMVTRLQAQLQPQSPFGSLHASYQRGIDAFLGGLGDAGYALDLDKGAGFYVDATSRSARGSDFGARSVLSGRMGYDFGVFAIYATGGGWTTVSKTPGPASTAASFGSGDLLGASGALGAGLVFKFSGNWAAFSEYRHSEFGQLSAPADAGFAAGAKLSQRVTDNAFMAGATYRFR